MASTQIYMNTDQQELIIAKNLIESPGWAFGTKTVEPIPNMPIEIAIKRFIKTLPEQERLQIRNLVDWVIDYEKSDKRGGDFYYQQQA